MKNAKLTCFFARSCLLPGYFLAVLLAGCFNPITAIPPKTGDPVTDPFTVDIMIGKDGSARTVAGPDSTKIKKSGIRNFIQLTVVDKATGQIVAFDEARRENGDDEAAVLSIDSIVFSRTYDFLLLMGHWEYDGSYNYYDEEPDFRPPTLLAAGLKELEVSGSGKITVVMWPIVIDTLFSSPGPDVPDAAPVINAGKPEAVNLFPLG
jgi:hypothetical protein